MRKVLDEKALRQVRHVEENAVVAAPLQLRVDAPRHHVARRQLAPGVVALHERFAGLVAQDSALAAQRFRDEEVLRLRVVQAGGVELDELEVGDGGAGAKSHREAVAGRDVGVRRIEIHLAAAARCQKHVRGGKCVNIAAPFLEHIHPKAAVWPIAPDLSGGDEIDRDMVFKYLNVRLGGHRREQGPLDFAARDILRVQDAPLGMAAFFAQVKFAPARLRHLPLGKTPPQLDQFSDARRALLDDGAHHVLFAESRPRFQRIAHVHLERILLARHRGDAALGIIGVRFSAVLFRDDGDAPVRRHLQGKRKARDPAAQNEVIERLNLRIQSRGRL